MLLSTTAALRPPHVPRSPIGMRTREPTALVGPYRRWVSGVLIDVFFFFSSRRRHTRCLSDWSSDVCSSDLDMINQLGERSPGHRITLRINPGFGHGHSQKVNTGGAQSKHGIWHEQLEDCIERATKYNLTISGLHMHIGSGTDLAHLSQVCTAMEQAALTVGSSIMAISPGGGSPLPYREGQQFMDVSAYFELWDKARHRLATEFGHEITLEIEPGRYLVAESGYLISEIRAIKTAGENTFYLVDAGFNNLARPILYGAFHPMAICPADGLKQSRPMRDVVVGGPLCESGDIFTQEEGGFVARRSLPEAKVGDFLIIGIAGAYGYV